VTNRAARQGFLGEQSEAILATASVAVVGNCGGGSHVAQQLAHVGIANFVLIDPDVTEDVNLNRMIGSRPEDAKAARQKTSVLRRLIRSINPDAQVQTLDQKWQHCAEFLRSCDLVFGCIDGYANRGELEAYCRRFLLPYIDVGMDVTRLDSKYVISGQIITSLPGRACMRCMGFLTEELMAREAARYGDAGPRPQVVWPNGVLASIAVGIGVHLLLPWAEEPVCPYLNYDGNRQQVTASSRLAHIDSSKCSHYPPHQVGDPLWTVSASAE
jgi:hypothetical protein